MVTDPPALLRELARALNALEIPYAVGGSIASGHHGEPRATNDVDVLVELDARRGHALVDRLRLGFHVDQEAFAHALREGGSFTAIHLASMVKVDFFLATDAKLDRLQLAHRQGVALEEAPDVEVYFTSREDQILRKLDWYQRSGGVLERQLRDIAGMLKVGGQRSTSPTCARPRPTWDSPSCWRRSCGTRGSRDG